MVVLWGVLLLLAMPLAAQDAAARQERIRAAMRGSLARQKASVARQFRNPPFIPLPAALAVLPSPTCAPLAPPELAKMIGAAAREHQVDAKLVREVARQESGFRPCVVSSKGAQGLMQLMPATQASLDVRDPFSPKESIEAGARLLKQLLLRYNGNLALALSAYNAGATRVDRDLAIPAIPETRSYVADILERLSASGP